ncbi:MAG: hypothetical protein ACRD3T_13355 [Terriglobia bacterium]
MILKRWFISAVACPLIFAVATNVGARTLPASEPGVQVSFSIPQSTVTLNEPAYLLFVVRNGTGRETTVYLGKNNTAGFRFTITDSTGKITHAPQAGAAGAGAWGKVLVDAGRSYAQDLLVNEWYHFDKPGNYKIEVELIEHALREPEKVLRTWVSGKMELTVLPRNPQRLDAVCRKLILTALSVSNYPAASEAALALSYVQDPVALPYLGQLLAGGNSLSPTAIRGLVRIGTPQAVSILESHLATSDTLLRSLIRSAVEEIKTGIHPTVED